MDDKEQLDVKGQIERHGFTRLLTGDRKEERST